jgi:hypothetical protein
MVATAMAVWVAAADGDTPSPPVPTTTVEASRSCVENEGEVVECEYLMPLPEVGEDESGGEARTEGKSGIGAATAVPEGEGAEAAEAEEGEGEARTTGSGGPAVKRAETIESPEATSAAEAADGGTLARSPASLKPQAPEGEDPTATVLGPAPRGSGLAGASTLPLGKIELPPMLLPVYQACGTTYDVPWEVLAAINKIESGFGSNMGPSSAGAVGPMQFMPATWKEDGLDADGDGTADAWDPFDAICAAARYLSSAGAPDHLHRAIFAYNHADWYVEEVLREARNFEALPENLLAALTALAEGETGPDPEATTYGEPAASSADALISHWVAVPSLLDREIGTAAGEGGEEAGSRGPIAKVNAPTGSHVTAVADSTVIARGHSGELGTYLILRDAYGTRYTYSGLGPLRRRVEEKGHGRTIRSAGSKDGRRRLYANPPSAGGHGGSVPLRKGTKVSAGTVLASVGDSAAPGFDFAVQPDGSGPVSPVAFLRAWKKGGASGIYLHEASAKERAATAKGAATARSASGANPAALLVAGEKRLRDEALHGHLLKLPGCLRKRIAQGALAPRALAGVEFLAAQGGEPIGISAEACAGDDRFRLKLVGLGKERIDGGSRPVSELLATARRMQGALGPQSVHGPAADGQATATASSAAVARISSTTAPLEGEGEGSSAAGVELDFFPPQAASLRGADAVAPVDAPAAVQAMVAAANQINQTPYIWGGGHGAWVSAGYDCSGSVSYVLHAAGLLGAPETSGSLASYGAPGPGRWVTIYANAEHVYAEIAGLRWDTVGDAQGSGPRWHLEAPYPEGFVVRHPVGL